MSSTPFTTELDLALESINYGLYGHGLYSYGLCSYGLYTYGLYSYGLYSYAQHPVCEGAGLGPEIDLNCQLAFVLPLLRDSAELIGLLDMCVDMCVQTCA